MARHAVVRPFSERVYAIVRRIPWGSVTTYGHIALLLDAPRCARQVGQALRELPRDLAWSIDTAATPATGEQAGNGQGETPPVPWHRVVNARGSVSPRGADVIARQVALLRSESVAVTDGGTLEGGLEAVGWFPEWGCVDGDQPTSGILFDAG